MSENGHVTNTQFYKWQLEHEKEHSDLKDIIERKVTWEHNDKEAEKQDVKNEGMERQIATIRARLAFYAGGITVLNVGIGIAIALGFGD